MEYKEAELLLYDAKRNERFIFFIKLYEQELKNNPTLAFKVFREAYCSTDNIYQQIKSSRILFNIKEFLLLSKEKSNLEEVMTEMEKNFYDNLPDSFKIYRGVSEKEDINKEYGISWSLSDEEAKKYINFKPNNVEKDKGKLSTEIVKKEDIITVFTVYESLNSEPKNEIIYVKK